MNSDPLLLDLAIEKGILAIMANDLHPRHMEMHDILQTASLPFVQTAVEPQLIPMFQRRQQIRVIEQYVRIESQQGIRFLTVDSWFHFHV